MRLFALRELQSLRREEGLRRNLEFEQRIDSAKAELDSGNLERASLLVTIAESEYPEELSTSRKALSILNALGRHDEVTALAEAGLNRDPHNPTYLEALATSARIRKHYDDALRYCETLRKRHPRLRFGYTIASTVLTSLGKHADADRLLAKGAKKIRNDIFIEVERARCASNMKDWPLAALRWQRVWKDFGNALAAVGAAAALKEMGHYDQAEQIIHTAQRRHPYDSSLWIELARIAEHRSDWVEAARRWENVRFRFPPLKIGYIEGCRVLSKLQSQRELKRLVASAIQRFPADAQLWTSYAGDA